MHFCEYCNRRMTIYGTCPDPTCPNSLKHGRIHMGRAANDETFSRITLVRAALISRCYLCNKPFESALNGCPTCKGLSLSVVTERQDAEDIDLDARMTIPVHIDRVIAEQYFIEPYSGIRKRPDLTAVSRSPDVTIRIEDVDDELAELLKLEGHV